MTQVFDAPANGDVFGTPYHGAFLELNTAGEVRWRESNSGDGYYTVARHTNDCQGYNVVDADAFHELLASAAEEILEADAEEDVDYRQELKMLAQEACMSVVVKALDAGAIEELEEEEEEETDLDRAIERCESLLEKHPENPALVALLDHLTDYTDCVERVQEDMLSGTWWSVKRESEDDEFQHLFTDEEFWANDFGTNAGKKTVEEWLNDFDKNRLDPSYWWDDAWDEDNKSSAYA